MVNLLQANEEKLGDIQTSFERSMDDCDLQLEFTKTKSQRDDLQKELQEMDTKYSRQLEQSFAQKEYLKFEHQTQLKKLQDTLTHKEMEISALKQDKQNLHNELMKVL